MVEYASYPEPSTIPQLETVEETEAMLQELAKDNEMVSVFWDRGWGDAGNPLEITIIVNGNGQMPKALINGEIYDDLRKRGVIDRNSLQTYKARKVHDFCSRWDRSRVKEAGEVVVTHRGNSNTA